MHTYIRTRWGVWGGCDEYTTGPPVGCVYTNPSCIVFRVLHNNGGCVLSTNWTNMWRPPLLTNPVAPPSLANTADYYRWRHYKRYVHVWPVCWTQIVAVDKAKYWRLWDDDRCACVSLLFGRIYAHIYGHVRLIWIETAGDCEFRWIEKCLARDEHRTARFQSVNQNSFFLAVRAIEIDKSVTC